MHTVRLSHKGEGSSAGHCCQLHRAAGALGHGGLSLCLTQSLRG